MNKKGSPTIVPAEVIRATVDEKEYQIKMLEALHQGNNKESAESISKIQDAAVQNTNIFDIAHGGSKTLLLGSNYQRAVPSWWTV